MNPLKRSADGAPSVPPPPSKSPAISVSAHRPHATAAVANPRATTRFRQPHIASGSELTAAAVVSQSRLEQLPTPRPVLGLHKYGGVIDPAPRAASGFSISADVDGSVMANAPTTITTNAAVGFVSTNPPATVTTPTPAVIKHSIQPGEEAATAAQERAEDIQYDENDDPNDSDDSDDSDDEGGPGHNASSSSFGMGHTITTTSSYTHHGGNLPLLSGSDDEDMTDPSIFLDTDPNDVDYDDNDEDDDDDDDGYLGDLDLEPEPEMSLEEERALMEEWFRENNIDNNK